MKRVGLYMRVSTADQTSRSQQVALEEYCRGRGLEIYKTYADNGISGAIRRRPQLDELMADARRRKFDSVIVFRFDRFARSTRHLLQALEEFRALKINFVSISEAVDTSTPLGEALFTIVGAIAQLERDITGERVRSGLQAAKRNGKRLGRPPLIDVSEALRWRSEGLSYANIAKKMGVSKPAIYKAVNKTLKNTA